MAVVVIDVLNDQKQKGKLIVFKFGLVNIKNN
jgi:hypothetical protein